jgi:hypothetical protein
VAMVMSETGEGGRTDRKLTTIAAKWDARGTRKRVACSPVNKFGMSLLGHPPVTPLNLAQRFLG